jgi:hypothetical protein
MIDCPDGLFHSGEKLSCAHDELLSIALQHDRRLAGGQGGSPLNSIGFASKGNLLSGTVLLKLQVIVLRIDLFHSRDFITHSQSKRKSLGETGQSEIDISSGREYSRIDKARRCESRS